MASLLLLLFWLLMKSSAARRIAQQGEVSMFANAVSVQPTSDYQAWQGATR
jgi:hypothetical protein